jgi:hypothetical protein
MRPAIISIIYAASFFSKRQLAAIALMLDEEEDNVALNDKKKSICYTSVSEIKCCSEWQLRIVCGFTSFSQTVLDDVEKFSFAGSDARAEAEISLQKWFRNIPGSYGEREEYSDECVDCWFVVKCLSFSLQIESKIFLICKYFDVMEKIFLLLLQYFLQMRQWKQHLVLLVSPYHFQPNILLVLLMPYQVYP